MKALKLRYKCVYFSDLIFDRSDDELFERYPLDIDDPIRDVIIVLDQDLIKYFLIEAHIDSGNLLYDFDRYVFDDQCNDLTSSIMAPDRSKKSEAKEICKIIKSLVCNNRTCTLNNLQEGNAGIWTLSRFAYLLYAKYPDKYHTILADTILINGLRIKTEHDFKHYFVKIPVQYRSEFTKVGREYISNYRTFAQIDTFDVLARLLCAITYDYNYRRMEERNE